MSEFGFLKVQKSFIVNPTKITRYDSNYLYIQDVKIPISRDAKLAILKQVKELMGVTI
jgi:DNA-binding LytR/AlgR family response regulator